MFGDQCCTISPNNTVPDGSVQKALDGLRTLSKKAHDNSGFDNPLDSWLSGILGKERHSHVYFYHCYFAFCFVRLLLYSLH